jgi:hypothetical protein
MTSVIESSIRNNDRFLELLAHEEDLGEPDPRRTRRWPTRFQKPRRNSGTVASNPKNPCVADLHCSNVSPIAGLLQNRSFTSFQGCSGFVTILAQEIVAYSTFSRGNSVNRA